ncbi:hypothetical protein AVEN_212789-1, partial [Araneus ventricosus]
IKCITILSASLTDRSDPEEERAVAPVVLRDAMLLGPGAGGGVRGVDFGPLRYSLAPHFHLETLDEGEPARGPRGGRLTQQVGVDVEQEEKAHGVEEHVESLQEGKQKTFQPKQVALRNGWTVVQQR